MSAPVATLLFHVLPPIRGAWERERVNRKKKSLDRQKHKQIRERGDEATGYEREISVNKSATGRNGKRSG